MATAATTTAAAASSTITALLGTTSAIGKDESLRKDSGVDETTSCSSSSSSSAVCPHAATIPILEESCISDDDTNQDHKELPLQQHRLRSAYILAQRARAFWHLREPRLALADAAASLTIHYTPPTDDDKNDEESSTWTLYRKALQAIVQQRQQQIRKESHLESDRNMVDILLTILPQACVPPQLTNVNHPVAQAENCTVAVSLLDLAETALQQLQWKRACDYYTSALLQQPTQDSTTGSAATTTTTKNTLTQAWLQEWAESSLSLDNYNHGNNMPHTALAVSMAALRVEWTVEAARILAQALLRLGEPHLAVVTLQAMLQHYSVSAPASHNLRPLQEMLLYANYLNQIVLSTHIDDNSQTSSSSSSSSRWTIGKLPLSKVPPTVWPNWVAHEYLEIYPTDHKGRGVRATQDLEAGQVILVERALVRCEIGVEVEHDDDDQDVSMIMENLNRIAQESLCEIMVSRSTQDAVFTSICHHLYDGRSSSTPPIVPFSQLLFNLKDTENRALLLLPSHFAYQQCNVATTSHSPLCSLNPLTLERAEGIVRNNAHGRSMVSSAASSMNATPASSEEGGTAVAVQYRRLVELYPALDMWNHDVNPNCRYCKLPAHKINGQDIAIVATTRPVAAGEELTISYGADHDRIRQAFGFGDHNRAA